jgi:hypothetical protein
LASRASIFGAACLGDEIRLRREDDHLATEDSGEETSPAKALKVAAEEKQVYASKDEERVEASEEVREEGTIHAEPIDDTFDDEPAPRYKRLQTA